MTKTIGVLFLLSLAFADHCLSQSINEIEKQSINENYREFKRFFEDEIELIRQKAGNRQRPLIRIIPETLPHWLTNTPQTNSDSLYVLGMSDPGMDSIAGTRMARQRALLIHLLSNELQLINLRDLFSREDGTQFNQTFTEYSEITVDAQLNALLAEVVYTHITQFGETIVMLRMPATNNDRKLESEPAYRVFAALYTQFKQHGNQLQTDEKLHLAMFIHDEDDPVHLDHHYIKIDQITNTQTYENDKLITDLPALRLQYNDLPSNDSFLHERHEKRYDTGISMHNGLWHAWISGYLLVLADGCQEGSIHFSSVSDIYNELNLSLSREFAACKLRAGMPSMRIVDNSLFLLFDDEAE